MAFEVLMPQLGLTMETGTVSQWLRQEGEPVRTGEALLEITTDKLTQEVTAERDGVLLRIVAREGEDVPVKGLLGYIGQAGEAVPGGAVPAAPAAAPAPTVREEVPPVPAAAGRRIRVSPLARKTAASLGVDYSGLTGTGTSGRIIQKDILAAAEAAKAAKAASQAAPGGLERMEGDQVVKLAGMRKVVAERMGSAHTQIPPVTQSIKVDVTKLLALRRQLLEETGRKYSVNDLLLKAVAKCLGRHREMLVSLDGDQIIQRAHVNLGMAVALEAGLIVPVIRDADRLGLEQLADAAGDLAARARENRLTPDDYKGSTFTVTNLGMFGIETFTPIINQPDAAILGACAIQDELVMDDQGAVSKRQFMRLSLTLDHRLLDGAVAARFQMDLRNLLESPLGLLL